MRKLASIVAVVVTAFAFLAGPSWAVDEDTIRKALADAGYAERLNSISIAAFCPSPRSNTSAKCYVDYDEHLANMAELTVRKLHYLIAKRAGAPKELLDVLELAKRRADAAAMRSGDRVNDLYWFDTAASSGTPGQATK